MSKSRKAADASGRESAESDATSPPAAPPPAEFPPSDSQRFVFRLLAVLAVAWTVVLATMGRLTANPAVVSPDQIRAAGAVVAGRIIDTGSGRVRVERVFAGAVDVDDELTILNLSEVNRSNLSGVWIFPLTPFRQSYRITTLEGQQDPPLIYEATSATIGQVKDQLRKEGR